MTRLPTCARPSCQNALPRIAVQHGDKWCSSTCCCLDHGQPVTKPRTLAQINAQRKSEMPKPPVPRERNVAA
jgi:hypothetical protein